MAAKRLSDIPITSRIIPQTRLDTLRVALARTKDKRLRKLIKEEIRRRENLGKDYPLEIEDLLG